MFADIFTIVWKELREIFSARPNLRGGWVGLLVFIGIFGVFLPLQSGVEFISSPQALLVWIWVPFILVNSVVADSFAGERERHTLETLLASRLTDRSILFGKLAAAILYGWGLSLVSVVLGVATVNVVHGQGRLLLMPLPNALGLLALGFLVATLAASLGVLVSLRASSVRQAQQTLSIAMFAVLIPIMLLPSLPAEYQMRLAQFMATADLQLLAVIGGGALAAADVVLILLAIARFRRARLILD